MDILQIRDGITRLMKCNYSRLSEGDAKRTRHYFLNLMEDFKFKLKEINNYQLLIDIIEEDKMNYDMPIKLMFLVYQRLIELQPNKDILLGFADYLELISGPDWEEEIDAIRMFVSDNKISEAIKVALKVDYYKYPVHEGL